MTRDIGIMPRVRSPVCALFCFGIMAAWTHWYSQVEIGKLHQRLAASEEVTKRERSGPVLSSFG